MPAVMDPGIAAPRIADGQTITVDETAGPPLGSTLSRRQMRPTFRATTVGPSWRRSRPSPSICRPRPTLEIGVSFELPNHFLNTEVGGSIQVNQLRMF